MAKPVIQLVAINLKRAGEIVARYGLVVIFLWIGSLKFTEYEAKAPRKIPRFFVASLPRAKPKGTSE